MLSIILLSALLDAHAGPALEPTVDASSLATRVEDLRVTADGRFDESGRVATSETLLSTNLGSGMLKKSEKDLKSICSTAGGPRSAAFSLVLVAGAMLLSRRRQ